MPGPQADSAADTSRCTSWWRIFCLLTRFSVPPYRGSSCPPAVGAGNGDAAIVGSAVGSGGAVGAMAGGGVGNAAVGLGAVVGNAIVGIGIGGAVGATSGWFVGDAATGAGLAGAGNASPSSEHVTADAAIAASVRITRQEWMIGRQ